MGFSNLGCLIAQLCHGQRGQALEIIGGNVRLAGNNGFNRWLCHG